MFDRSTAVFIAAAILVTGCGPAITPGIAGTNIGTDAANEQQATNALLAAQHDVKKSVEAVSAQTQTCSNGKIVPIVLIKPTTTVPIIPVSTTTPSITLLQATEHQATVVNATVLATTTQVNAAKAKADAANKAVKTNNSDAAQSVSSALQYIALYQKSLNDIATKYKDQSATVTGDIATAKTIVSGAGAFIPAAAPFTGVATAAMDVVGALWTGAETQLQNDELQKFAQQSDGMLKAAVATLKQNFQAFSGPGRSAYDDWKDCARGEFAYLRDGRDAPFAPTSGVALKQEWDAYESQKTTFKSKLITQQNFDKDLDAVLAQNTTLAQGQQPSLSTTTTVVTGLAGNLNTLCAAFKNAENPAAKATGCSL